MRLRLNTQKSYSTELLPSQQDKSSQTLQTVRFEFNKYMKPIQTNSFILLAIFQENKQPHFTTSQLIKVNKRPLNFIIIAGCRLTANVPLMVSFHQIMYSFYPYTGRGRTEREFPRQFFFHQVKNMSKFSLVQF